MAARSIGSETISFELVNVPVKAHTAVRDDDIHVHQLEKRSASRIRNREVAEKSGEEVDTDDIEMGLERLSVAPPKAHRDVPAGGTPLIQPVVGDVATMVAGEVTRKDDADADAGARPGRLVRGH